MRVLIVDGNAVCYSAYFTTGQLRKQAGTTTGLFFGFFNQIMKACTITGCGHVIFTWDSKQSFRKKLFPEYKSNRKNKKQDPELIRAFADFKRLRSDILPRLGFSDSFFQIGYEADDIIARLCLEPPLGVHYVVMSGDHDLYQLLNGKVDMYKMDKSPCIYTVQDFENEYGIAPGIWSQVKAYAGCVTDGVPGVTGIGEKRAIDFLMGRASNKVKEMAEAPEAHKIVVRNLPLVQLPFTGTKRVSPKFELPSYAEWLDFCEENEFFTFLDDSISWARLFAGHAPGSDFKDKIKIGKK